MAAKMYAKGKQKILDGTLLLLTHNLKIMGVAAGYVRDTDVDEFLDDIAGGDQIGATGNLASKTVSAGGIFDAADPTIPAVPAGPDITQFVLYRDTGSAATSPLIANWDTATGLPYTPNGSDLTLQISAGANKLFAWND